MLDINDFIKERGGNPEKIKESQRRRHAPEEIVDEIIEMFEDHRKTQYAAATEMGAKINKVQKEMGSKCGNWRTGCDKAPSVCCLREYNQLHGR